MTCPLADAEGKTIVQVKAPVCLTIRMDEADAAEMTQEELCGLIDEAIDEIWQAVSVRACELHARRVMNSTPVEFCVTRYWDELPVDELEISSQDVGFFQKRGDEDEEE